MKTKHHLKKSIASSSSWESKKRLPEISKIFRIPLKTLYNWSAQKRFPHYKVSRFVYVDVDEFHDWLSTHFREGHGFKNSKNNETQKEPGGPQDRKTPRRNKIVREENQNV